ncbi:Gag protease polyprotein [Gossypium australe]|uniref:Gag protease polyprotein n=1 Tax=Gossypium australe TaxID=47621 RepID=A0A5B6WQV9_9ROSI|nr:Gag protease polyprotein [Gossypium australe]
MDFVLGLPLSLKMKDAIWVVVDRLTKFAHLILVKTDYSLDILVELYISKIVRLHGVPLFIISDRALRFTSRFYCKLHEALSKKLNFSIAFHPQMDEQLERFAYNNNYQSSIKMSPYELLYGHKWRTPLYRLELSERKLVGTDLIHETKDKVKVIRDCLKIASDYQKSRKFYVLAEKENLARGSFGRMRFSKESDLLHIN